MQQPEPMDVEGVGGSSSSSAAAGAAASSSASSAASGSGAGDAARPTPTYDTIKHENIKCLNESGTVMGAFRMNVAQVGWKNKQKKDHMVSFMLGEVLRFEYFRIMKGVAVVKFSTRKKMYKFEGFDPATLALVINAMKQHGAEIVQTKLASDGANWGTIRPEGPLEYNFFTDKGELLFDFNPADINQISNPAKNDLHIEFCEGEAEEEELGEIRLYVHNVRGNPKGQTTKAEALKAEIEDRVGEDLTSGGDSVCELTDIRLHVPAGKFELKFQQQALTLHGKSNDFVIRYQSIARFFYLPQVRSESCFVIQLTHPLRHGAQAHNFINISIDQNTLVPYSVQVRNHKLMERYGLHNQDLYCNRALYYLINNLLKMLTQKPCIVPMTSFISTNGKNSVGCMYKSNQGLLFPLKNQFIFVPKPTLSIPYDQVSAVTCVRGQGNVASAGNRFFDLTVVVDSSAGTRSAFEFQHLERADLNPLFKILKQNGVECPDFVATEAEKKKGEIDASQIDHHLDDDEDDEDWQAGADEDSADSDLSASDDEGAGMPGAAPPAKRRKRG